MKRIYTVICCVMICSSILMIFCGGSQDDDIIDAAKLYKINGQKERKNLEELVINRIEQNRITKKNVSLTDSFIYTENSGEIQILYPIRRTVTDIENWEFIFITLNQDRMALTDGSSIYCCDEISDSLYRTNEKNSIKSLSISGNSIYFYKSYQLYKFDINTKKVNLVVMGSFPPPYKKLFNVALKHYKDNIGISSGIAGSYYIAVVDVTNKSIRISNVKAASSSFALKENSLWYLGGSIGNWEVTHIDLTTKRKSIIYRINSINNFAITPSGYMYENSDGLYISDYSHDPINFPLSFRLIGQCGNSIVMRYDQTIISDFDKIYETSELINNALKK